MFEFHHNTEEAREILVNENAIISIQEDKINGGSTIYLKGGYNGSSMHSINVKEDYKTLRLMLLK